jgi:hypothetical protein
MVIDIRSPSFISWNSISLLGEQVVQAASYYTCNGTSRKVPKVELPVL